MVKHKPMTRALIGKSKAQRWEDKRQTKRSAIDRRRMGEESWETFYRGFLADSCAQPAPKLYRC